MRKLRLAISVCLAAILVPGLALADESVTVDYGVLNQLPPAAKGDVAPKLVPPSLVRKQPKASKSLEAANAPAAVNSVPAVFQNDAAAYNAPEAGAADELVVASLERSEPARTSRTVKPSPSANAVAPAYTQAPPALIAWANARPLGKVTFVGGGVEVMDIDAKSLAGLEDMADRLRGPGERVLLKAFGGSAGDKSHEAHLVALKRGLAVRKYLIARGVPSTRIDVRAFGGATDGGPEDRVDVVMSAG